MATSDDTKNNSTVKTNREAILKELESVRRFLKEESAPLETQEAFVKNKTRKEEFQIPLLDPIKTTTHEINFSKPASEQATQKNTELDIPTIDDITQSGSLFDDDEDEKPSNNNKTTNTVTQAQLKAHAQLIIQDLLNDVIPDIEDKLAAMVPGLEEKLKKRLEKAMNEYIEKALNS